MSQIHESRLSDNRFIDRVWKSQNVSDGVYVSTPDCSWDIIVLIQPDGSRSVMLTGQAAEAAEVPYKGGTSSVVVSFAAGAYMPDYPGRRMLNLFEMLPNDGPDHFILSGHRFAIPTFEAAEDLVTQMEQTGLLKMDDVVAAIIMGSPKALSDRATQRHFLETTGLTRKALEQIKRAQAAVSQLQQGKRPADVAADTGYTDQAHLSKSLQKIMRSRPSNVDDIHKL